MSKKYRSKIMYKRDFGDTIETKVRFRSTKRADQLDVDDMRYLFAQAKKGFTSETKSLVGGMNGQRYFNFKKYKDPEIKVQDFEDYYKNSVKEVDKFEKFMYIDITVHRKK